MSMHLNVPACSLLLSSMMLAMVPPLPDGRGPVANAGMTVKVDAEGVQAPGYRFQPVLGESHAFRASWIWLPAGLAVAPPNGAWFRKEVTLAKPQSVVARVTADAVYRLWINGVLVSRGPADHGNDIDPRSRWSHRWLYDVRDLTPFFREGTNIIAAEVFAKGHPNFTLGKPGFLFEAEVRAAGGQSQIIATGKDWSVRPAAAYTVAGNGDESYLQYDAAKEPRDWRASNPGPGWLQAEAVESVWGKLWASEVPPRMEQVYPWTRLARAGEGVTAQGHTVRVAGNGKFAIDFDRVMSAYVSVRVVGPAGAVVMIEPNERKQAGYHRRTGFVLRPGETVYEYPLMDSFSTLNFEVRGASGPVTFNDIRASFISYPVQYAGSFESSDAELNRLWKSLRWATQLCMQTHHLDSPHHQEPISDPGDYLIEAVENYYAFGEPWLARQDLRKFGLLLKNSGYLNFHTSYSLLWLQMLVDYYDYTGDEALVRELAPVAHGLLDRFAGWRGKNGLISEAPNYMFMDWVETGGIPCHHPPAVIGQGYMTAFYYRGLADARRIAVLEGDTARASRYEELRAATADAFERELWNAEKGLYRDGKPFQTSVKPSEWLPADTQMETLSPQVNSLAVLYGLAPKERQAAILDRLFGGGPANVQPYFMHFSFDAMEKAGAFEKLALGQMRRWKIEPETATVREMWTDGDYSHGWGGTPLVQMSARILGVTPAEPGYRVIAVRPETCGLAWARGVVPTPKGKVSVDWKRAAGEFRMRVTIPAGAEVTVPVDGFAKPVVRVDGKVMDSPQLKVAAGIHEFVVAEEK